MKIIDNDERKYNVKRIKPFRAMLDDNVNEEPHIFQEKKQNQGFIGFLQNSEPICMKPCEKMFILFSFTSDFTENSIQLI